MRLRLLSITGVLALACVLTTGAAHAAGSAYSSAQELRTEIGGTSCTAPGVLSSHHGAIGVNVAGTNFGVSIALSGATPNSTYNVYVRCHYPALGQLTTNKYGEGTKHFSRSGAPSYPFDIDIVNVTTSGQESFVGGPFTGPK